MVNFILIGLLTAAFTLSLTQHSSNLKKTALLKKNLLPSQRKTRSTFSILTSKENFEPQMTTTGLDKKTRSENFYSKNNMQIEGYSSTLPSILVSLSNFPDKENYFSFDVEAPIETILTFCPSQSCQYENHAMPNIGIGCCIPCDCSDRCIAAGTCCMDRTNGSQYDSQGPSFSLPDETCVNTLITSMNNISQIYSYLLFQKCTDNLDYEIRKKCLHPDVFQLDEVMPVYSPLTNRHYRNVFCSKCNNDSSNMVLWQTFLICNSNLSSGIPSLSVNFSISEIISTNPSCSLSWVPPPTVKKVDICLPEQNIVSDCDTPVLDTLCKQYYAPVKGGSVIYKNVFCMECANPSNLTGSYEHCNTGTFNDRHQVEFTSILSMSLDQNFYLKSDFTDINICPSLKRYNDYLDACIYHTCAVSEMYMAGVCKPLFSKLMGIHLEYRLKVLYRKKSTELWNYLPILLFDINIMTVLGLPFTDNDLCFSEVLNVTFSSDFVEIRTVFFKYVHTTNVEQAYNEYEKNIENYNEMVKENKNTFMLQVDKSDIEPVLEDSVTLIQFSTSDFTHTCPNNVAISKLQFCDTITFLTDEFKINGNGTVIIDNLMFGQGEFILRKRLNGAIKSVQVCLDDYISKYTFINRKYRNTSAAECGGKRSSGILYLLCAVIVLSQQ